MTRHCLPWTDLPETEAPSGVAKRSLEGRGANLVRAKIPAGTEAPRHSHDHGQFVQVIAGSGVPEFCPAGTVAPTGAETLSPSSLSRTDSFQSAFRFAAPE